MMYLTGFHAIEEYIRSGRGRGPLLVAKTGPRGKQITALAHERGIPLQRTGQHQLDTLAPDNRGLALEIQETARPGAAGAAGAAAAGTAGEHPATLEQFLEALAEDGGGGKADVLVVVADEITDPHNYGAVIRSCDQFGVDLIVSRGRRNAKHAATVAQSSAGASAWAAQVEEANIPRALERLKEAGFWIYGADMAGEPLYQTNLTGKTALVLGGEAGLSRLLKESCDKLLAIPASGKVDSLNVSVAAGVFLYEITRQRLRPSL